MIYEGDQLKKNFEKWKQTPFRSIHVVTKAGG